MTDDGVTIAPRTVVEAFLSGAGEVPLEPVHDVAAAAGVADQSLRLALRRMAAAGEIVRTGRGRTGAVAPTPAGRARLERDRAGVRLAFAQDHARAPWDGRWRMLALSVPESERPVRDALRRRLGELGLAVVSTGLYLGPHPLDGLLGDVDSGHLVRAEVTGLDVRGVTDDRGIAELLWPAAPVVAGYAVLDRVLARVAPPGRPLAARSREEVLVHRLLLAEALERALRDDPLLPPELRTDPWPPESARHRWYAAWEELAGRTPDVPWYRDWLGPVSDAR